jgi:hypothetical protein
MKLFLSTLLCLISINPLLGQQIQGKEEAQPGTLVVLEPVEIKDARTVWDINYPERFEEYAEENQKLFIAMPNTPVSFTLLIVPNNVNEPLRKIRHVIVPSGELVDPPPIDPPPVDPPPVDPGLDPTDSPLYEATRKAYKDITDDDKDKWAEQMAQGFLSVVDRIQNDQFSSWEEMMKYVVASNQGLLPGQNPFPPESRQAWADFRSVINYEMLRLEDAGKLNRKDLDTFIIHWLAIRQGLLDEAN